MVIHYPVSTSVQFAWSEFGNYRTKPISVVSVGGMVYLINCIERSYKS